MFLLNSIYILLLLTTFPAVAEAKSSCERVKELEEASKAVTPTKVNRLDIRCTATGHYEPVQCFAAPNTRLCYCALPDGTPVTAPSSWNVLNSSSEKTVGPQKSCTCLLEKFTVERGLMVGGEAVTAPNGTWIPSCTAEGHYSRRQCEVGTNICWCVHANGSPASNEKAVGLTCK